MNNFGLAVRFFRRIAEMDLSEVAEKAGVTVSYVSLIETGKRTPMLDVADNIASAMGVPLSTVVKMAENFDSMKITDCDESITIVFSVDKKKVEDEPVSN